MMNEPTRDVLRFLLSNKLASFMEVGPAAMRLACEEWLEETGGDRDKAECELAGQLRDDMHDCCCGCKGADPETRVHMEMQHEGLLHVNFRAVARSLMNRYCPKRRRPLWTASVN